MELKTHFRINSHIIIDTNDLDQLPRIELRVGKVLFADKFFKFFFYQPFSVAKYQQGESNIILTCSLDAQCRHGLIEDIMQQFLWHPRLLWGIFPPGCLGKPSRKY